MVAIRMIFVGMSLSYNIMHTSHAVYGFWHFDANVKLQLLAATICTCMSHLTKRLASQLIKVHLCIAIYCRVAWQQQENLAHTMLAVSFEVTTSTWFALKKLSYKLYLGYRSNVKDDHYPIQKHARTIRPSGQATKGHVYCNRHAHSSM